MCIGRRKRHDIRMPKRRNMLLTVDRQFKVEASSVSVEFVPILLMGTTSSTLRLLQQVRCHDGSNAMIRLLHRRQVAPEHLLLDQSSKVQCVIGVIIAAGLNGNITETLALDAYHDHD